jgi:hypothetical protein
MEDDRPTSLLLPTGAAPLDSPKKPRTAKRAFTAEEDDHLAELVKQHGDHVWRDIEQLMPGRSSRQCRERWNLYLSPDVCNDPWTQDEDMQLLRLYQAQGPKWTQIAKAFPKRTANNVKNRQKQLLRRVQRIARFNGLPADWLWDDGKVVRGAKAGIIVPISHDGPAGQDKGDANLG